MKAPRVLSTGNAIIKLPLTPAEAEAEEREREQQWLREEQQRLEQLERERRAAGQIDEPAPELTAHERRSAQLASIREEARSLIGAQHRHPAPIVGVVNSLAYGLINLSGVLQELLGEMRAAQGQDDELPKTA